VRYALSAPAIFWWETEGGVHHRGVGVTRDISSNGAFVYAANCPPAPVPIQIEICLPSREAPRGVQIQMQGKVLRIEGLDGGMKQGFGFFSEQSTMKSVANGPGEELL
jgi:PilZ domain